jgi:hypothetical protein
MIMLIIIDGVDDDDDDHDYDYDCNDYQQDC